MEQIEKTAYTQTQRMRLRGLILLSSEIIAHYWPMRSFVHHNPLHGLEHLHFEEAVRQGDRFLGGKGYLSGRLFREYFRTGRILPDQIDAVLKPLAHDKHVVVGEHRISHFDILRACLLNGIPEKFDEGILQVRIDRSAIRSFLETLANHLTPVLKPPALRERLRDVVEEDRNAIGRRLTLSDWCDRALGTRIREQINSEMIKWCEAFLDEGHAAWPMPNRDKGFYLAWKSVAALEWFPCGIRRSRQKLTLLPERPEDALMECLIALGIPEETWQDYLTLHLTAMPGWTGFIKWRADQTDYEWQQAYPADLAEYLAVRLWYERELVEKNCLKEIGIAGNLGAVSTYMQSQPDKYALERERIAGHLPADYAAMVDRTDHTGFRQESRKNCWNSLAGRFVSEYGPRQDQALRLAAAWRLYRIAKSLNINTDRLIETPPEDLKILLDWIDTFPESEQGPVWLKAFEAGYQKKLLARLASDSLKKDGTVPGNDTESPAMQSSPVRPQTQAVFCIDVRSEPFRRHLEAVGDHETFGFAGFFTVFIRYRGLGVDHETDQFPVIMKAKNAVRELSRAYQDRSFLSRHRAGTKLLHMRHELLHDLKENVITPYVMVESVGWFYSLPLIGKTLLSLWYRNLTTRLRRVFAPPVATTLTIDKLSREEVEEMLTSEQRAVIRRALQQQFGDRDLNLSLERLEGLRRRALDETPAAPFKAVAASDASRPYALTPEEETAFIADLRGRYRISRRWAFARMERITRTGFTINEQIFTVETALRMMGLTKNFARLILFCGHGSTSDNNPFEAALDCGACGGNAGKPNARVLAAMANKPQVRESLAKAGILIPTDTYFIAGQHNTTTDEVEIFDLEDLPPTHRRDLHRLMDDLKEAGRQNNRERCAHFPEIQSIPSVSQAKREVHRRSGDWSQVRPEWGLSGNAAFIIGRNTMVRRIDLQGRVFLQSYDYREDPTGKLLEIVMTGPQVVGQWINMEHYFSTVSGEVYGSGSKIYHNVVGRFGVMSGPQSDLRIGLATQTVMNGLRPYHEPIRMITIIEAPPDRISQIILRHKFLQHYYDNEWVRLIALDPNEKMFYLYIPKRDWVPLDLGAPNP